MATIGELYYAVITWAGSQGAVNLKATEGLWHGKTEARDGLGPFDVWINPHAEEIDDIDGFHVGIGTPQHMIPLIAHVGPTGGVIMHSSISGQNEEGLTNHFRAQTP